MLIGNGTSLGNPLIFLILPLVSSGLALRQVASLDTYLKQTPG